MTTTTNRVEELPLLMLGSLVASATSSELLLLDSMFPDLRISACDFLLLSSFLRFPAVVGGVTLQVTGTEGSALVM